MSCIFGGPDQWRTVMELDPERVHKIANFEHVFGQYHQKPGELPRPKTIHRKLTVLEQSDKGKSHVPEGIDPEVIREALSPGYSLPIVIPEGEPWVLPAGAFKDTAGPT